MNPELLIDAALLQISIKKIEDVKSDLVEMQDLEAYNQHLASSWAFIEKHASKGNIPEDPLLHLQQYIGQCLTTIDNQNLEINRFLGFESELIDLIPKPAITQNRLQTSSTSLEEQRVALVNFPSRILEQFTQLESSFNSNPTESVNSLINAENLSGTNALICSSISNSRNIDKINQIIVHASDGFNLIDYRRHLELAMGGGAIFEKIHKYHDQLQSAISFHQDNLRYHFERLKIIANETKLFKVKSARAAFDDLVASGCYGGLEYLKVKELLDQYTAPIAKLNARASQLTAEVADVVKMINSLRISDMFSKRYESIDSRIETVEASLTQLKSYSPDFLTRLNGTEFFELFVTTKQTTDQFLTSRLSAAESSFVEKKKAAVTKLCFIAVGIGTGLIGTFVALIF
mgnify:CR=1 FL=1|tara:strand:- start:154 stop:1365 length:1212 start_codon:yes stop_codon:yes gene_type:complete